MGRSRTQLLLEPEQHEKLQQIARYEQRSMSDLVREAVATYLGSREALTRQAAGLAALARARELRAAMKPLGIAASELLAHMREARDGEKLSSLAEAEDDDVRR